MAKTLVPVLAVILGTVLTASFTRASAREEHERRTAFEADAREAASKEAAAVREANAKEAAAVREHEERKAAAQREATKEESERARLLKEEQDEAERERAKAEELLARRRGHIQASLHDTEITLRALIEMATDPTNEPDASHFARVVLYSPDGEICRWVLYAMQAVKRGIKDKTEAERRAVCLAHLTQAWVRLSRLRVDPDLCADHMPVSEHDAQMLLNAISVDQSPY